MIRKHKKFSRPRQLYDSVRIEEENKIVTKYGLKNKKEIWKAKSKLGTIRNRAKKIVNEDQEQQERFLEKLRKEGFGVKSAVDVLALTEEDILKRRLQTVLVSKKLATAAKGARQMIVHKHVTINDKVVDVPSYMVSLDEENKIKVLLKPIIQKKNKEVIKEVEEETE
ncbi:MAG: 30S ribosomal protein S4 [Candidatus Pacearchaeota archaeon]|jgi:small subunit ribosomal protein S4